MNVARVSLIALVPLAEHHRDAFIQEELANYAEERVRDAAWPRSQALERACAELLPVLERELAEAGQQGHDLWSAINTDGVVVGWLWVRPSEERLRSAF